MKVNYKKTGYYFSIIVLILAIISAALDKTNLSLACLGFALTYAILGIQSEPNKETIEIKNEIQEIKRILIARNEQVNNESD